MEWLAKTGADIFCLQEVRASDDQLAKVLADAGLGHLQLAHTEAAVSGRAGAAIASRYPLLAVQVGLAPPQFAASGRWIEATVATDLGPVTAASVYVQPGEAETDRQVEKYKFLDAVSQRMTELLAQAAAGLGEVVVCGDFNIAHRQADLKNWRGNLGKSGFLPAEQAYLDRWLAAGWTDLVRADAGDVAGPYTWWSWRGKAFDHDTGWRIDYQWATPQLAAGMTSCQVGRAHSYANRWSDHAAVTTFFTS